MKLSQDSVKNLSLLLQSAALVGIDKLIIGDGRIRGMDEKKSVALITGNNVPDFGGLSVGLNRLNVLENRLNIVKNDEKCIVEALEDDKNGGVKSLMLYGGSSKVQYRCASVEAIRGVPKGINDTYFWLVSIPQASVPTLVQAASAMGADRLIVTGKTDGVYLDFVDSNQDIFSMKIAEDAEWIPTDIDRKQLSFVNNYPIKSCLPLIRAAGKDGDVSLLIGERGIMEITVNGYTFMVLPTDE